MTMNATALCIDLLSEKEFTTCLPGKVWVHLVFFLRYELLRNIGVYQGFGGFCFRAESLAILSVDL